MQYIYFAPEENVTSNAQAKIKKYAQAHSIPANHIFEDELSNKVHWERRDLKNLIENVCKKGDHLISYEASCLARSTLQLLEVLQILAEKQLSLYLIRYDELFTPSNMVDTDYFLNLVQHIEGEYVTKRTTDALARRRAAGLPLGRPKGRKNKSRKLDKHKEDIQRYLALNISKASIAKLVGCHAQTLYNYLEDREIGSDAQPQKDNSLIEAR